MKIVPFSNNRWGIVRYRKNAKVGELLFEYYVFGTDEPLWTTMSSAQFEEGCLSTKEEAEQTLKKLQEQ